MARRILIRTATLDVYQQCCTICFNYFSFIVFLLLSLFYSLVIRRRKRKFISLIFVDVLLHFHNS
uniref:Uncharacterized protein n=1 Tax=Solanum lycopersicum TaxID=4081 RepID=A0A3Q7F477_SOLLC